MPIEKIDQSSDKEDSFGTFVQEVVAFVNSPERSIKDRLYIERKLRNYQDSNSQDWLLNLLLEVTLECQKKMNKKS